MCAFSTSLTTTVFSQRSMWRFETVPHRTIPEGQQSSIFHRALIPPSDCLPTTRFLIRGALDAEVQHLVDPLGHPFGQLVGLLAGAFDARGAGGDALLGGVGVQAAQLAEGCGRQVGRPGVDGGVDRPAGPPQRLAHLRGPGLALRVGSQTACRSRIRWAQHSWTPVTFPPRPGSLYLWLLCWIGMIR